MYTKPYSVSIVYQEQAGSNSTKTMLRVMHVDAMSEEEAVGIGMKEIPKKDRTVKNALILIAIALEIKLTENNDTDDKPDDSEMERP